MVRPDITGLLAPVGDEDALREAILKLIKDESKREEMSQNCRRIAMQEYSLEVQAKTYGKLYESIIASSEGRKYYT